jgi:hypothetical protein
MFAAPRWAVITIGSRSSVMVNSPSATCTGSTASASVADHVTIRCLCRNRYAPNVVQMINTLTIITSSRCVHSAKIRIAEYGAFATMVGWKNGTHIP